MMVLPFRCWRGRDDCDPLHSIELTPAGISDEEYEDPGFYPKRFTCGGCIRRRGEGGEVKYRLCCKTEDVDAMTDHDLPDLSHVGAVVSQVIAVVIDRVIVGRPLTEAELADPAPVDGVLQEHRHGA